MSRWLGEVPPDVLDYRRHEAELLFRRIGITFAVYAEAEAQERLIPFDVIPSIMSGAEWRLLEKGLIQRVKPLNLLLKDVYGAREILRAGARRSGVPQSSVSSRDERTERALQRLYPHRRYRR